MPPPQPESPAVPEKAATVATDMQSGTAESTGRLGLDQAYFRIAQEQVDVYRQREPGISEEQRPLWQIPYAAACIALVCAAMEAHVNYMLMLSAQGDLPNRTSLSVSRCKSLMQSKNVQQRWIIACTTLTGQHLLDPELPPFRGFCEAVQTRNEHIAHSASNEQDYPSDPADWEEARKLNIGTAQAAIQAAQATVCAVYAGMGKQPPAWATTGGGPPVPTQSVTVHVPRLELRLSLLPPTVVTGVAAPPQEDTDPETGR